MAGFVPSVRFGVVLGFVGLLVLSCTCRVWTLLASEAGGVPALPDAWSPVVVKAAHAIPAEAIRRKTLLSI